MAAMKKKETPGTTSEETTTTTPSQDEAAATQANGTNNDGISVDTIADGQHEVNLLDLGVLAEDIAVMRRIEKARRAQQQALEVGPSERQMITRAKGKETMLTEAERQEQYNKLGEVEHHCKALQEKLRAQQLLLEKMQAPPPPPPKETVATNPPRHVPPRVRPRIIPIEEISDRSESDGEEHYRRGYQRRTPLSDELEEI